MALCHLSRHGHPSILSQNLPDDLQTFFYPVRRLEKNMGVGKEAEPLRLLQNLAPLPGKESSEVKSLTEEPRAGEGGNGGGGSRHRVDGQPPVEGLFHKKRSGVGDQGGSRIRDQGDRLTLFQTVKEDGGFFGPIVLVIGNAGGLDSVVVEEGAGDPGVFGGHKMHPLQDLEGAECDILQVPDGRGHHIECPCRVAIHGRGPLR